MIRHLARLRDLENKDAPATHPVLATRQHDDAERLAALLPRGVELLAVRRRPEPDAAR